MPAIMTPDAIVPVGVVCVGVEVVVWLGVEPALITAARDPASARPVRVHSRRAARFTSYVFRVVKIRGSFVMIPSAPQSTSRWASACSSTVQA
jgi:hypothetical protein